jgi:hypothetical protein
VCVTQGGTGKRGPGCPACHGTGVFEKSGGDHSRLKEKRTEEKMGEKTAELSALCFLSFRWVSVVLALLFVLIDFSPPGLPPAASLLSRSLSLSLMTLLSCLWLNYL